MTVSVKPRSMVDATRSGTLRQMIVLDGWHSFTLPTYQAGRAHLDRGVLEIGFGTTINLMETLKSVYHMTNAARIKRVLDMSMTLSNLAQQAPGRIQEIFGNAELRMSATRLSGSPGTDRLIVEIVTDLTPVEAVKRLGELDDTWWLDAARDAEDRMEITLAFE